MSGRVFGLPLHPFLVHAPITLWFGASLLDVWAIIAGSKPLLGWAFGLFCAGAAFGAGAVVTGFLDYLHPALAGVDLRLAARHGVRTAGAWCAFAARCAAGALMPAGLWSSGICISLDLLGCVLLAQGIYLGTRQVYQRLMSD